MYEIINKDNVIMSELEKRQSLLTEYDAKIAEKAEIEARLDKLNAELATTDKEKLAAEIAELEGYAAQMGFIKYPVVEAEMPAENVQEVQTPTDVI